MTGAASPGGGSRGAGAAGGPMVGQVAATDAGSSGFAGVNAVPGGAPLASVASVEAPLPGVDVIGAARVGAASTGADRGKTAQATGFPSREQGWISPATGAPLVRVGPHVLAAGDERWPVLDEIPFLRLDRRALADRALAAIDAGDPLGACALLLTDQDPFAPDPPPGVDETAAVLADEPALSFREAMARLKLGRVADYFAHRWSDPTFLSGLVLLTAFERGPVLELCCGAGHFLPEFSKLGLRPIGGDLVFAKLWLCRHFVCPEANLVCFDAQLRWPIPADDLAGVFCHDAFYFLPDKAAVAAQMAGRPVVVGHAHNARADNHSSGLPLIPEGYAALFGNDAAMFDDRALTEAFVSRDAPAAVPSAALAAAEAISFVSPARLRVRPARLDRAPGAALRLNPLYRREPDAAVAQIMWPSERYAAEYGPLATYPLEWDGRPADEEAVRRRVYLELPPRW